MSYTIILTEMIKIISKKDAQIISHLRNNARKKITQISKEIHIPVTTIYDKLRNYEQKFTKKHTTLLDFPKLGLNGRSHVAIKVEKNSREELKKFLIEHPNVNSLSRINFSSDFLAEVVFKTIIDVQNFVEKLVEKYDAKIQIFNIIEELKKEDFLTKEEHFKLFESE
jgi:DNA-binding Lrp family transcriptional regulator